MVTCSVWGYYRIIRLIVSRRRISIKEVVKVFVKEDLTELNIILANGEWRRLVAHLLWEQGVAGSNPVSPTSIIFHLHTRR